jgi:acetylglutamate kinase
MKRVVKIGGRAQSSADLAERIATAWRERPGSFCVVHGGGDRISEFQRRVGLEPSFVDGRRVTTRADMEIVRWFSRAGEQGARCGFRCSGCSSRWHFGAKTQR